MAMNRKEFLRGACAMAVTGATGCANAKFAVPADAKIRSALLHLGMNMWGGWRAPNEVKDPALQYTREVCPTETDSWNAIIDRMHERHFNHAVIDLGGGVEFPSHPELTVKGSWTAQRLRDEVKRLSDLGIEAVPKLNFSTCHDAWLGKYERMVSTRKYYQVVRDVIDDACEIFGNPRHFHIGMDEEDKGNQRKYPYMVIRNGELWWHDLKFYFDCLAQHGARPIMFACSAAAHYEDAFFRQLPKDVIPNLAIYGHGHTIAAAKEMYKKCPCLTHKREYMAMELFRKMTDMGYDVLTCASNWVNPDKLPKPLGTGKDFPQDRESTAWFHDFVAREIVDMSHFAGGLTAPWQVIRSTTLYYWQSAIDQLADAMDAHGWKS